MNWKERISVDLEICHGRPCIRGTRVMVSVILDNLAAGETTEAIVHGYNIEEIDIQAALQYAADPGRDRVVVLPTRDACCTLTRPSNCGATVTTP